jgi:hypothetical protein
MLWSVRCGVSITSELFHDIFGYRKVGVSIVVIPFQVDSTIWLASMVLDNFVSFFPEGIVEMLKVVFADIFDPNNVNCQVEPYLMGFVPP